MKTDSGFPEALTRREAIRRVSTLFGGAALVGQSAMLASCATAQDAENVLFSGREIALLDEIADTILPDTDTASDGHVILISVQNDREWEALATSVLKRPDLVEDPNFNDNAARMTRRSEVDGLVQDFFGRHTKAQMTAKLLEARLAFGSLNMMEEFVRHPLLRRWQVESETGSISVPAHPDANREWRQLSLPRIGEHSDAIRAEFAD